ncbi:MAG: hypothetical protein A2341_26690 [Deltaproteobacteria bacterium RIFOXYB12_FULL_58_9]|nr:MAG: hypothetical protein A2341_26690 [Deltaproteobacteria bacterium RIFOXYB12_FULL_58_9]
MTATRHQDNLNQRRSGVRQLLQGLEGLGQRFRAGKSQPRGDAETPEDLQKTLGFEYQPIGTILIVEVDGWRREALLPPLRSAGYKVRVVDDRAALETVQGEPPLLVIVGGVADLSLYRSLHYASPAPILALVPEADRDQLLTAFAAGVDDYQVSPISNTEIAARVQAMLRHAKRLPLAARPTW